MDVKALELLNKLKQDNERLSSEKNEQAEKIRLLEEQLNDLLRRLDGRKSERFENPDQTTLFDLLESQDEPKPEEQAQPELESVSYQRRRFLKRGPKPLPEHLERIVEHIDPPADERICACCAEEMARVDEIVTEELDIVPSVFRVKQYVQGKYRCRGCMNRNLIKALPPRPIEKGRPSPSLLAHIVVSKYVDHLPLNRQEQIFRREGVSLARSTMDEWLGVLSPLLLAVVLAMKRRLLGGDYLQIDETPIEALDRELKRKTKRCYLWSYGTPTGEVVYDVTTSRAGRHPRDFIAGFRGFAQTDGYAGYGEVFAQRGVGHIACMAHIRRKFFEAKHALPERVEEILTLIRSLYDVEAEAREKKLSSSARVELRHESSRPILEELKSRIDDLAPIPTPKSKLGKATRYALGQWGAMERYLDVGEAEIDNNACERSIRPAVIGRKNFLFLGSAKAGGERASVFYSLTQSAKRLGLNPFEYLRDAIERISTTPTEYIDELTPASWKRARERAEKSPAVPAG